MQDDNVHDFHVLASAAPVHDWHAARSDGCMAADNEKMVNGGSAIEARRLGH